MKVKMNQEAWAFILDIVKNGKGKDVIDSLKDERKEFLNFLSSDRADESDFPFHLWGIEIMTKALEIYADQRGESL